MRKLRWCGVLLLLAVPAAAQEEAPKADLFGGYSFASLDGGTGSSRLKLNGWNGSVTGNFNRWFGVTADFSGHYGSRAGVDLNAHSFLFGPRFSYRGNQRVTPFVHSLFGAVRTHRDLFDPGLPGPIIPARSETGFGLAFGGGLDINASPRLAIRVIQADYLLTRLDESSGIICFSSILPCPTTTSTGTQHNFRFSTGVVFRFGGR